MRRSLLAALVALGVLLTLVGPAHSACIVATSPLSFGVYNVFASTPLDSTGSLTYLCTPPSVSIRISLDRGGAATFNPRRMLKGSELLSYNLYLNAARTTIWGDGTGGSQEFTDHSPPFNRSVVVPIYGRIPALQDVSAGTYSNTITATIQF
jgi:spore coat protein U-like protein